MGAALPWIAAALLAAAGYLAGRRWRPAPRLPASPWKRVLLLADPEQGPLPLPALVVATRLVGPRAVLDVLAPIRVPLAVSLEAPAGEETERATALLDELERAAGQVGVSVRTHLLRGRSVGGMLREVVGRVGAEAVVMAGTPEQWRECVAEIAPAQAVLVPAQR